MTRTRILLVLAAVAAIAAPGVAADVADRLPLTYQVEHDKRADKNCLGTLTVDKWQFKYESDACPDDNRTWRTTEIREVESKRSDELVLRTRESSAAKLGFDRNYRFRVLGGGIEPEVVAYMRGRVK
jgi:hypothetical protein